MARCYAPPMVSRCVVSGTWGLTPPVHQFSNWTMQFRVQQAMHVATFGIVCEVFHGFFSDQVCPANESYAMPS